MALKQKKKKPHLEKRKWLFDQGNARVNKFVATSVRIHGLGYELLPYLAYSLDVALCKAVDW